MFLSADPLNSFHQGNVRPSTAASHQYAVVIAAICASENNATDGRWIRTARTSPFRSNRKCCDSHTIAGVKIAHTYQ